MVFNNVDISTLLKKNSLNISPWEQILQTSEDKKLAAAAIIQMQELENKRISMDLHDSIGQSLTSLLLQIRTIQQEPDNEIMRAKLDDLYNIAAETLQDVRRISHNLQPTVLENLGLIEAIHWRLEQFQNCTGVQTTFNSAYSESLPKEIELTLYHVVQESLTNISKHAHAKNVKIVIGGNANRILMSIRDDGQGINPNADSSGLGILSMGERVQLLGGSFSMKSEPGKGVNTLIEIPLHTS